MNKSIATAYKGEPEFIGFFPIVRSLPNKHVRMIGHFSFLDQVPLKSYPIKEFRENVNKMGDTSHPHRGIATLTYLFKGGVEHFDSAGHHGIVSEGGMQWMKAGNGIIHDEVIVTDDKVSQITLNGLQFWINLPAKNKAEKPDYMAIQSNEIPEVALENSVGILRVLVGQYSNAISKIPTYSDMFAYHIKINANHVFSIRIEEEKETALVVTNGTALINDERTQLSEMIIFDTSGETININNNTEKSIDIVLFGGEKYTESIAMGGPFIMNTTQEIIKANQDYTSGKYGKIIR